jgi:hypothetical protein
MALAKTVGKIASIEATARATEQRLAKLRQDEATAMSRVAAMTASIERMERDRRRLPEREYQCIERWYCHTSHSIRCDAPAGEGHCSRVAGAGNGDPSGRPRGPGKVGARESAGDVILLYTGRWKRRAALGAWPREARLVTSVTDILRCLNGREADWPLDKRAWCNTGIRQANSDLALPF